MIINKYTAWLVLAVIIFCTGMAAGVYWLAPALTTHNTTTIEKQPITIEGKTITETKLAYVPGETVYLPTPTAENQQATTATKLDGKFTMDKPTFTYMVNGKPGQFVKTDDERYIFDKNEISLTQTSTINIKAEIPTIDLTRHNVVTGGIFYSNGKASLGAGYTGSVGKVGAYQLVGSKSGGYAGIGIKF